MKNCKFIDLHSDVLTCNKSKNEVVTEIKNNKKMGYKSINAIFRDKMSLDSAVAIANYYWGCGVKNIAFEDCCYEDFLLKDGSDKHAVKENMRLLVSTLKKFNPLYLSLGWNYDNLFAGGCLQNGRLSTYGHTFIKILNDEGIAVDCAHLNEISFYEVVDLAEKVLCSHTAISDIFPHKRNISYRAINKLIHKKGIIGITAVGHFLTGIKGNKKNYESAFYEHIDGFLQNFGAECLAIGTDFYGTNALAFNREDYNEVYQRTIYNLQKLGVGEKDAKKITYANAENFFGGKI
ncbi:MAG: membrane dipeptidase [Clostridia bacterium]|nr:membrane dipeptidase [Clostridia bacterium]